MNDLLFAFYGDDFTGSTDALEALTLGGIPTVLFLEPPERETLAQHFPDVRAVGVAGISRSLSPAKMEAELRPAFAALKALGAPFVQYKVCSTFDSSPMVGSIGRVIDIGSEICGSRLVPVVVGAPALRRFLCFGNLFATAEDSTYRIDRHPTMSKHPVTPMDEGDLRLHLVRQTQKAIGLIDLVTMNDGVAVVQRALDQLVELNVEVVLFDTLDNNHILIIGDIIGSTKGKTPVFIAGSSGVENAMIAYWQAKGMVDHEPELPAPGRVEQIIVMSGSASPATAEQIEWAIEHGYDAFRLDAVKLVDDRVADSECERVIQQGLDRLRAGKNLLMYSALGLDDPAIHATADHLRDIGRDASAAGERLGSQQGKILRWLLEETDIRRGSVAGGDTCGHSMRQLGIYALEALGSITTGVPLCRLRSHNPRFDGLEFALKGGQVGQLDLFDRVKDGTVT